MILRPAERVLSSGLEQLLAQLLSVMQMMTYCPDKTHALTLRTRRSMHQYYFLHCR